MIGDSSELGFALPGRTWGLARADQARDWWDMQWNPRVYLKAFDVGLQDTFIYRWNFLLRSVFELLPLMGTVLIWGVVFDQRQEGVGGVDFKSGGAFFLIFLFLE